MEFVFKFMHCTVYLTNSKNLLIFDTVEAVIFIFNRIQLMMKTRFIEYLIKITGNI